MFSFSITCENIRHISNGDEVCSYSRLISGNNQVAKPRYQVTTHLVREILLHRGFLLHEIDAVAGRVCETLDTEAAHLSTHRRTKLSRVRVRMKLRGGYKKVQSAPGINSNFSTNAINFNTPEITRLFSSSATAIIPWQQKRSVYPNCYHKSSQLTVRRWPPLPITFRLDSLFSKKRKS